jgi:hypothetical protein
MSLLIEKKCHSFLSGINIELVHHSFPSARTIFIKNDENGDDGIMIMFKMWNENYIFQKKGKTDIASFYFVKKNKIYYLDGVECTYTLNKNHYSNGFITLCQKNSVSPETSLALYARMILSTFFGTNELVYSQIEIPTYDFILNFEALKNEIMDFSLSTLYRIPPKKK